ncbi:ATP-dependent carboxylate-amine ligase [Mesorhizobium caraganae]|uniref:ATP-dependent carboxylate-amine ligase n=1 Tax=Mesorhizobium caraganae TaxID=483206 RepID=UPI003ECFFA8C
MHLILDIIRGICDDHSARVVAEPRYGRAGYIEFAGGHKRFFRGNSFDINLQGAAAIAKDKHYCAHFLNAAGLSVPLGILLYSPKFVAEMSLKRHDFDSHGAGLEGALDFCAQHGLPVFVKPNDGSEGKGVQRIHSIDELFVSIAGLFDEHPKILVQQVASGRDFRVVVLAGQIVAAFERVPLSIAGDGATSIESLLDDKLRALRVEDGQLVDRGDARIARTLASQGLRLESVPNAGVRVQLLPNANLSTGGAAVGGLESTPPIVLETATAASRAIGLTLAGVDLMFDASRGDCVVLEVNSAPDLNSLAKSGIAEPTQLRAICHKLLGLMGERVDDALVSTG